MPFEKFPQLKKNAARIIFLLGSAYVSEPMFSRMKHIKSKNICSISDGHLEHCLRLATSSLEPDNSFFVNKLAFYVLCKFVFVNYEQK